MASPTASEERAAVVAWLRRTSKTRRGSAEALAVLDRHGAADREAARSAVLGIAADDIEQGRHWDGR